MKFEVHPLTENAPYFLQAVEVYSEYVPGDLRYHTFFFQTHMNRQGFTGLVALHEDRVIGFAFGSDSLAGQWWHEKVLMNLADEKEHLLQDAWVLTQFNVLEAYRNHGVGGVLHDTIIQAQIRSNLLLSTPVTNLAAQRFYQRRGWHVIHRGFAFGRGSEPFMILHLAHGRAQNMP
jgi:GNAT superfamily N-acetyltransferase